MVPNYTNETQAQILRWIGCVKPYLQRFHQMECKERNKKANARQHAAHIGQDFEANLFDIYSRLLRYSHEQGKVRQVSAFADCESFVRTVQLTAVGGPVAENRGNVKYTLIFGEKVHEIYTRRYIFQDQLIPGEIKIVNPERKQ